MGSRGSIQPSTVRSTVVSTTPEVPWEYRLPAGDDARQYFEYGGYIASYTVDQFVQDSRTVDLYGGIDFERSSSSYYPQQVQYEEAVKRWRKQLQYNREVSRTGLNLVSMSSNKLKTLYNSSTSDDVKQRIAAELNVRGFYQVNGKWRTRGGGK